MDQTTPARAVLSLDRVGPAKRLWPRSTMPETLSSTGPCRSAAPPRLPALPLCGTRPMPRSMHFCGPEQPQIRSGVSDSSYNGMFPVWYLTDSTHISWSQTGANSTSSGGTILSQSGGDTSGLSVERNTFFESALAGVSISSASITSSILSVTLASPAIIYPNQWVWTTGSSDPVYNAYWQVLTVTSPTTFTAQSIWSSEAPTTSGTLYLSTEGLSIGANSYANRSASVCCLTIEKNNFYGNPSTTGPWPLFGIVEDGVNGNTMPNRGQRS